MSETELVFFVYSCSANDGLETLVAPDSENLDYYEDRECETLDRILWWEVDAETAQEGR